MWRNAQETAGTARASRVPEPIVRRLGLVDYEPTYRSMQRFTGARGPASPDEIWLLQHPPIYTVGVAGRPEHFPAAGTIPVKRVDRGGQITYHGPGQAVVYVLLDLARRGLTVRAVVRALEQAVIEGIAAHGIEGERRPGAPGVYVRGAKLAALGLRVRHGCCYHGVALNVDMDLTPFSAIDPCGYPGLAVTQTSALGVAAGVDAVGEALVRRIAVKIEAGR